MRCSRSSSKAATSSSPTPQAACAATSYASRRALASGSSCRLTTSRAAASSTATASSLSDLLDALGSARVFDLEQLRYAGAPSHPAHTPGFNYFLHRHHARGAGQARTGASAIVVMPEHSGTHTHALPHHPNNLTLHGGFHSDAPVQTSLRFRVLGIDTLAPLVT